MKTKRILGIIISAAVVILFLQGCGTSSRVTLTKNDLQGDWVLKSLNGKEANTLFSRTVPTLQFNFAEKTISGTGGCNRYTGRFVMINNLLSTPNLASTRMFCFDPNAEDEFFQLLRQDKTLRLKNGVLQMLNEKKVVVLEFERMPQSQQSVRPELLTGSWHLVKMDNQMAFDIFRWEGGSVPVITFDTQNRRISGMAGCNRFNTGFVFEQNLLMISPAVTTRMACPNLEGENRFLQALRGSFQLSMPDSDTLRLIRDNQLLLEFKRGEKSNLEMA